MLIEYHKLKNLPSISSSCAYRVSFDKSCRVSQVLCVPSIEKTLSYRVSNTNSCRVSNFILLPSLDLAWTYRVSPFCWVLNIIWTCRVSIFVRLIEYLPEPSCRVWNFFWHTYRVSLGLRFVEFLVAPKVIEYHFARDYRVSPILKTVEFGLV